METKIKKQTKKLTGGSFINHLMANNSTIPVVGKGATVLLYSDRKCYEVIEVSKDSKTVKLEDLQAICDKSLGGGIGHQNWILTPNGYFTTIVWRHNGWYIKGEEIVFTKEFIEKCESEGIYSFAAHLKKTDIELFNKIWDGQVFPHNVVEGITKLKNTYSKINIIFGTKDYYYDWSF
jgi:hypothetical protein